MENGDVSLNDQAYGLALRGVAAVEANDVDEMTVARSEILQFLPYLCDSTYDSWAFGLTKVASAIQQALEGNHSRAAIL
jgi:hypothetical protein